MAVFNQDVIINLFLILQIPQSAINPVINQEDNAGFNC